MPVTFREIGRTDRDEFRERIAALERGVTYPLGKDRFEIDHGDDYFAFFDRLGDVSYVAALDGDRVVAVVAAVLRSVPFASDEAPRTTWYLCDLKVRPDDRTRRITARMFAWALPRKEDDCPRAYAISMNPPGSANRVAHLLARLPGANLAPAANLELYSLDAREMAAALPDLVAARGPVSFLSLEGKKDIVLQSTGAPMPLLHVQFGALAERKLDEPADGHVHMLCAPDDDPLAEALRRRGHAPSATATLMQRGMDRCDWRFVLTSDI